MRIYIASKNTIQLNVYKCNTAIQNEVDGTRQFYALEHLLDESIYLITLLSASTSFVEVVKLLSSEAALG